MVPALLMLRNHEAGMKAIDERLEQEQDKVVTMLIQRGVKEGVLPVDLDFPEAIAQLLGPLLFAFLTELVPVDDGFADRTVDRFVAAYRPS